MCGSEQHLENKHFKSCLLVVLRTDLPKHKFWLFTNWHCDIVISASFWSVYCKWITTKSVQITANVWFETATHRRQRGQCSQVECTLLKIQSLVNPYILPIRVSELPDWSLFLNSHTLIFTCICSEMLAVWRLAVIKQSSAATLVGWGGQNTLEYSNERTGFGWDLF